MTKSLDASFEKLVDVIKALRDPESGCPWDLKQDLKSLRKYMIEEAFEAVDALGSESVDDQIEELGDVLLQVVLNAQIISETSENSILHVIDGITNKMIRRHPHVFSESSSNISVEAVKDNWQRIKDKEKAAKVGTKQSMFSDLDKNPGSSSLRHACDIGKRSKTVSFDWGSPFDVLEKVKEEIRELEEEMGQDIIENHRVYEEMGDLLFGVSQLCRHLKIEPETCLHDANKKFVRRFQSMESLEPSAFQPPIQQERLEVLWKKVKDNEKA